MIEYEYLLWRKYQILVFEDLEIINFDGEYLNGNKKGKEYDRDGHLIFEGEYLDNKRWNGKSKEFDYKKYNNF